MALDAEVLPRLRKAPILRQALRVGPHKEATVLGPTGDLRFGLPENRCTRGLDSGGMQLSFRGHAMSRVAFFPQMESPIPDAHGALAPWTVCLKLLAHVPLVGPP